MQTSYSRRRPYARHIRPITGRAASCANEHIRSSRVGFVLQVLKRVLCLVDGRVELALELALVLLALSFALGVLVAGDGADGLLCAAADLVGLLAHCRASYDCGGLWPRHLALSDEEPSQ